MGRRIGVALSGGGYRAAAFHLGTLRALNKLGILSKIDVISSVSGGSITSAFYGLHKNAEFESFEQNLICGLRKSSINGCFFNLLIVVCIPIVLSLLFSSWWYLLYFLLIPFGFYIIPSSKWIAHSYDRIFFKGKQLKDLPDTPIIGINSTNIKKGRLFTFSKQDVGGYDYKDNGRSIIDGLNIPISFAVSCSTCVPMFFSPRKIKSKFFVKDKYRDHLLIDGGLYDNQGAYILSESSNQLYRVENIIVSDAGNSEPSTAFMKNTVCLMCQSLEVLMNRIRTVQIKNNIYKPRYDINNQRTNFAYISLRWDDLKSMPDRFVENIKHGYVDKEVLNYHHISENEVEMLMKNDNENIRRILIQRFKSSVNWNGMIEKAPSYEEYKIAYSVGTNLMPLSLKQIYTLSAFAEWLTELQVKTYLPHLLTK